MNTALAEDSRVENPKYRVFVGYDNDKKAAICMSQRETIIANEFIKTSSIAACIKALGKIGQGWVKSADTVKRWLARPHVQEYTRGHMVARAKAAGLTRDKWIEAGIDKTMDGYYWKELGKAMGYYEDGGNQVQLNQQINFVQGNGNP